jgi:hypothetical protein
MKINKKDYRLLRALIREEIGHNFKTKDNDPYQYYETDSEVQVEIYPVSNGFIASITVPKDESLSAYDRLFPTEAECNLYARNYVDRVRKILASKEV